MEKSNSKNRIIELPKREICLNYTLSNRDNSTHATFLFKEGLSLITRRPSFNSNINFLFSLVKTLWFLKDSE